ncbi:hypothetical protein K469DRAFT_634359 [Zopfia rhizophila CBS 207.26]|uniref:Heterokaryon incompatibility domain-containing protein n=1 Tax=Zopfia rhizophila CBS 207.26 TaxID=1314779 RepID=A0A6A6E2Q0_9PEZI|nr:hypothetical protein K469DRAFT_634359 [Zopfia rhizophila CBS 207.26]
MATLLSRTRPSKLFAQSIPGHVGRRDTFSNFHCAPRLHGQLRPLASRSRIRPGEIRLLRGRRTRDGTLHGDLETFSLASPDLPPFHAVSYTWGLPGYKESINVEGKQSPVLDSLSPFLHIAFKERPGKWWWIDSICIDQKDNHEKSCQIPLMGRIFQIAERVDVWLGEKTANSDTAMAFLEFLGLDFYSYELNPESVASRSGYYSGHWIAVESLFRRAWWRRVWTVQECIVARDLLFYCGNSKINRAILGRALSSIWNCHGAQGTLRYDAQWNRYRIAEWHWSANEKVRKHGFSLAATLAYLGDHHSTDPRDRIYSLGGLVNDFDLAGVPNYVQPMQTLYTNLVRSFVERYRSLDIICFATIFSRKLPEHRPEAELPSWVPDWRVTVPPLVCPLMVSQSAGRIGNLRPHHSLKYSAFYSASLHTEPNVSFTSDLQQLNCEGILLDRINTLTNPLDQIRTSYLPSSNAFDRDSSQSTALSDSSINFRWQDKISTNVSGTSELASQIARSLMRCLVLDRGDHYLNRQAPEQKYMKEFLTCIADTMDDALDVDVCFPAWFRANQCFRIQDFNLRTLARILIGGSRMRCREVSNRSNRESFISRFHDTTVKMARRLAVSDTGLLATAPKQAKKGDFICVLFGCSVPVVLRQCGSTGAYRFIGECYVDGFMNGEAMQSERAFEKRTFRLM